MSLPSCPKCQSDYVYEDEFYQGKIQGFNKFSETVCSPHENSLPEKSLEFNIFKLYIL